MNCDFCHQPCLRALYDGHYGPDISIYECPNHLPRIVKYYIFPKQPSGLGCSKNGYQAVISCQYENRIYHLRFFHTNNPVYPNDKFRIDRNNLPPKRGGLVLLTLSFYPDFTPENVLEKLPAYLSFI